MLCPKLDTQSLMSSHTYQTISWHNVVCLCIVKSNHQAQQQLAVRASIFWLGVRPLELVIYFSATVKFSTYGK